jgi:AraC-like DNA-binding protein
MAGPPKEIRENPILKPCMNPNEGKVNAQWEQYDKRCSIQALPVEGACAEPFRAIGLVLGGVDLLRGRFHAGTDCSNTHLLWCVAEGRVRCNCKMGNHILNSGQYVICPAGTPHWITLESRSAKGLWFHFEDQPRWKPLKAIKMSAGHRVEYGPLQAAMESCMEEARKQDQRSVQLACLYAEIVSLQLLRLLERETSGISPPPPQLDALWSRISAAPADSWNIRRLSQAAGICASHLHALCLKHYGSSPMEQLTRMRMRQASDLLLHSPRSLEDISECVGYSTAFSFSHAFQRHMGCRPGAWRKRFRTG